MSGIIGQGSKSGVIGQNDNKSQDAWMYAADNNASIDYAGAIVDFPIETFSGSNITESAGTVTVGVSGLYWINCRIQTHGGSDEFSWVYEGSELPYYKGARHYNSDSHAYHVVSSEILIPMSATDTVALRGDTLRVYGDDQNNATGGFTSIFQGFRIGGIE